MAISGTPFERLFVGGLRDAERLASANPLQIATVINLSLEQSMRKCKEIYYEHIPIPDDQVVPAPKLDEALMAITQHIRGGRVLVHCAAGMSRSVGVAGLYMHVVGYTTFEAALRTIAQQREVDLSPAMKRSIRNYPEAI
ncbi:MAG: dual specificity protein phosphatase family protein [Acidobacteriia bacterium]|nr:dual specificity protein phosphatase family protein [Terriglobia bacterium]